MNIRDDAVGTEWKRWERSDPSEVRLSQVGFLKREQARRQINLLR